MRKFKVKVVQEKEYEVEIDENIINDEYINTFEEVFYDLDQEYDKIKSLVSDYCRLRAKGYTGNLDGYGYVLEDGKIPFEARVMGFTEKEDINTGINFKVIDDGEKWMDIEVKEI